MSEQQLTIPVPIPTEISGPFWSACRRSELMVQNCGECGAFVFIPQAACTTCLSASLDWVQSSGVGVLYSYSVVWRPQQPAFQVPYVAAIIELDEGWHMLSNLVDAELNSIRVGMRVRVCFKPVTETITLPLFRPDDDATQDVRQLKP